MATTDPVKDAFARARSRLALVHPLPRTPGGLELYSVNSSRDPETAYVVSVVGAELRCTCPSEIRTACWHRAAVAIRRANDRARAEHLARSAGLMDPAPVPAAPRRLPPRRLPPMDYYDRVELQARRGAR